MKKLIIAILVIVMIPVISLAETDLSSLTYSQLLTLRNELNAELMSRSEWKEVEVPAGTWVVGDQIPAGTYCIKVTDRLAGVSVWKKAVDDYSDNGLYYNEVITEKSPCGRLTLKKGYIVEISYPVIFTPPMSLGF